MRFDCFTLFPAMLVSPFDSSIIKRAQTTGAVEIHIHDLRDWTYDRHRTADDDEADVLLRRLQGAVDEHEGAHGSRSFRW